MAERPNVSLMRKGYEAFNKGDVATMTDLFSENVTWHFYGDNQLSGEHRGRDAVFAVFGRLAELSGGTFHLEIHDVVANDEHTIGLSRATAEHGGRRLESATIDVMHVTGGKITEFWSVIADQRANDGFWP